MYRIHFGHQSSTSSDGPLALVLPAYPAFSYDFMKLLVHDGGQNSIGLLAILGDHSMQADSMCVLVFLA